MSSKNKNKEKKIILSVMGNISSGKTSILSNLLLSKNN